jgi:histidinol-phosphate aminotransferase
MSNFNLERLVRPHIIAMKPYSSARDEYSGTEGVFLDANENALGSVANGNYSRYPDPLQAELKSKIAELYSLKPENIFLGNGSDEPIDLIIRAFCRPNIDNVLLLPPTYGMYKVSAVLNEIAIKNVPLTADFQIDTEHVFKAIDSYSKVVFLCSPNNPTGNNLAAEDIEKILTNFEGIVVVDQAYSDFCPEADFSKLLAQYPNLIILKTFSKAWGMAALRLGMAVASSEIVAILNKIKPPYNINIFTQQKGLEALQNVQIKEKYVQNILKLRELLVQQLRQCPLVEKVYPSDANFVLVRFADAPSIFKYLITNKIIVRDRSTELNCENCIRITVGTQAENDTLMQVLASYEAK